MPAFMACAKTVKGDWPEVVQLVESRITNARLEDINSKVLSPKNVPEAIETPTALST